MVDREVLVEAAVAFLGVAALAAMVVGIGVVYATDGGFSPTGGLALVGAVALFVLFMSAIGIALSRL